MTMTSEAPFSANFKMFNMDGLAVQFTVRADKQQEHMQLLQAQIDQLTKSGWRVTEPTGNLKPKILHVTGWVKGTAEDKREATFKPCVHLYADYGEFKQCTVYHERLAELPVEFGKAKTWDGAAPDKDTASKRGVLNHCSFDVVLEPIMLADGNPKTNDKGYTQYRYGGVKGAAVETVSDFTLNDVKPMNQNGPNGPDEGDELFATFKWHKDEEWLHIAAGIIQMGELTGLESRLVTYTVKLHNESGDKKLSSVSAKGGQGQYGYLVSLIDSRYGGNSHGMILSALCGVPISKDNPPGWKLKELIDWLVAPDSNKKSLDTLDKVVEFIKEVVKETEGA